MEEAPTFGVVYFADFLNPQCNLEVKAGYAKCTNKATKVGSVTVTQRKNGNLDDGWLTPVFKHMVQNYAQAWRKKFPDVEEIVVCDQFYGDNSATIPVLALWAACPHANFRVMHYGDLFDFARRELGCNSRYFDGNDADCMKLRERVDKRAESLGDRDMWLMAFALQSLGIVRLERAAGKMEVYQKSTDKLLDREGVMALAVATVWRYKRNEVDIRQVVENYRYPRHEITWN